MGSTSSPSAAGAVAATCVAATAADTAAAVSAACAVWGDGAAATGSVTPSTLSWNLDWLAFFLRHAYAPYPTSSKMTPARPASAIGLPRNSSSRLASAAAAGLTAGFAATGEGFAAGAGAGFGASAAGFGVSTAGFGASAAGFAATTTAGLGASGAGA